MATDHQRKALAIRDKGCVMPGCDIEATRTEVHHAHNWAHGGKTDLNNMALLCWHHHRELDLNRVELNRNQQHSNTQPKNQTQPAILERHPHPTRQLAQPQIEARSLLIQQCI